MLAAARRQAASRNTVFNFNSTTYMDLETTDVVFSSCGYFHFKEERIISTSEKISRIQNVSHGEIFLSHPLLHFPHSFNIFFRELENVKESS